MLETTEDPPEGFPIQDLPERPEEFAPPSRRRKSMD